MRAGSGVEQVQHVPFLGMQLQGAVVSGKTGGTVSHGMPAPTVIRTGMPAGSNPSRQ